MTTDTVNPADAALLRLIGTPAACIRTTDNGYEIDVTFDDAARLRALADVLDGIQRMNSATRDEAEIVAKYLAGGDVETFAAAYHSTLWPRIGQLVAAVLPLIER